MYTGNSRNSNILKHFSTGPHTPDNCTLLSTSARGAAAAGCCDSTPHTANNTVLRFQTTNTVAHRHHDSIHHTSPTLPHTCLLRIQAIFGVANMRKNSAGTSDIFHNTPNSSATAKRHHAYLPNTHASQQADKQVLQTTTTFAETHPVFHTSTQQQSGPLSRPHHAPCTPLLHTKGSVTQYEGIWQSQRTPMGHVCDFRPRMMRVVTKVTHKPETP